MANYKSIDLFAGIGGIRLGFDNAFNEEGSCYKIKLCLQVRFKD